MPDETTHWNNDLLSKIVEYLDDPEDFSGVWRSFCFLEARGFDVGLMRHQLHGYLTDVMHSPVDDPQNLSADQERDLVLALRIVARRAMHLTSLGNKELQEWGYCPPTPSPPPPRQLRPAYPRYEPTAEELGALKGRIRREEPNLLQALRTISIENAKSSQTEMARLSTIWIGHRLEWYVRSMFPYLGGVDQSDIVQTVIDDAGANMTPCP